jgi:hypothetical protein
MVSYVEIASRLAVSREFHTELRCFEFWVGVARMSPAPQADPNTIRGDNLGMVMGYEAAAILLLGALMFWVCWLIAAPL